MRVHRHDLHLVLSGLRAKVRGPGSIVLLIRTDTGLLQNGGDIAQGSDTYAIAGSTVHADAECFYPKPLPELQVTQ